MVPVGVTSPDKNPSSRLSAQPWIIDALVNQILVGTVDSVGLGSVLPLVLGVELDTQPVRRPPGEGAENVLPVVLDPVAIVVGVPALALVTDPVAGFTLPDRCRMINLDTPIQMGPAVRHPGTQAGGDHRAPLLQVGAFRDIVDVAAAEIGRAVGHRSRAPDQFDRLDAVEAGKDSRRGCCPGVGR